ncbi:MAG TPA: hypothetical protein P5067_02060 [Candidatus Marinimicrobia bacterium]|nr:hypothetical protein [Candidatus Neomarinimicrobiota bacterium]HRS51204.1 hypothetical protein [Candidatus Neomarinimicrobiota bacterium]
MKMKFGEFVKSMIKNWIRKSPQSGATHTYQRAKWMRYRKFALFICLSSLINCSPSENNLLPLEGRIFFKISEDYKQYNRESNPEIFLFMETEKIYGCCNYGIYTDCDIVGKKIVVNILGIDQPGVCLTAIGPAIARIHLPLSNKSYSLKISGDDFTDNYTVVVTDSSISVTGDSTVNTKPEIELFWRYPPNSFVYLYGSTFEDSSLANVFLDTLMQVIDIAEFYFPQNGEIPYPKSSMGHHWDMPARYFYYNSENDFDLIEEVLRVFKNNYIKDKVGIGITIKNWRNKQINSWLL